jgi:hypothetical protein
MRCWPFCPFAKSQLARRSRREAHDRPIPGDHQLAGFVAAAHLKKTNYLQIGFEESLAAFASRRSALLKRLKKLPPSGWERGATVTGTTHGKQTVRSLAERMGVHEERHVDQLSRTVEAL